MPGSQAEAWKRMVLHSMPMPAWLSHDAPHSDIALSSRVRIMRNLVGFRFPNRAPREELIEVQKLVLAAAPDGLESFKHLTPAERDHLVGGRLASPEFQFEAPGRAVLLNKERTCSVMVNEEDHIRLQALTGGWSAENADAIAELFIREFSERLNFAESPRYGFLAASPFNAGEGKRMSAMFHLIGLAHSKRLPNVLKALNLKGISSRGLFGEASRAVGAYVQVSMTDGRRSEFVGACDYLLTEERSARRDAGRADLAEKAKQAIDFAIGSPIITAADAFRVLGWARWAAVAGLEFANYHPRDVDTWLTTVELHGEQGDDKTARSRADFLRGCLERS
jgi:protein arginine kinase